MQNVRGSKKERKKERMNEKRKGRTSQQTYLQVHQCICDMHKHHCKINYVNMESPWRLLYEIYLTKSPVIHAM